MIVPMTKVRLFGPAPLLADVLRSVQDAGVVHLTPPPELPALSRRPPDPKEERRRRHLARAIDDAGRALELLGLRPDRASGAPPAEPAGIAAGARLAGRVRRAAERLERRRRELEEERVLLDRYRGLFQVMLSLLEARRRMPGATAYHIVLRRDQARVLPALRQALDRVIGATFELISRGLPGGETAVLLLVPGAASATVDRLLADTRVNELPVPRGYGERLEEAIPRMQARAESLPGELTALERERNALARRHAPALLEASRAFHDEQSRLDALGLSAASAGAFVLEGWTPAEAQPRLRSAIEAAFGDRVAIEVVAREHWRRDESVPVVLANPRLFRPFEMITRMVPLPRYGSIDATPYVAVFFPMFFGLMLGDAGYGAAAALLAWLLHRASAPGSTRRTVAEVLGACALFAIAFGVGFGEYFGDLGRRWLGLRPLVMDREHALLPFLGLAVALGVVHVLLGLVLGAVSQIRAHPRVAAGRGLSALMVVLIIVALLAAFEVLPRRLLTPATILLLVAFPLLVVLEGIVAPVEFLATLGHILSYARIMALGTASVMLAMVANELSGAMGSFAVGALFALLFHLVNFALGLFSPTIHSLRLHYVEFFGTFYSPGGMRYEPLAHWAPHPNRSA